MTAVAPFDRRYEDGPQPPASPALLPTLFLARRMPAADAKGLVVDMAAAGLLLRSEATAALRRLGLVEA